MGRYLDNQTGLPIHGMVQPTGAREAGALPPSLVLEPISRRPLRLPPSTIRIALDSRLPSPSMRRVIEQGKSARRASIVMVTHNGLVFTKLCLISLLANTDYPDYEVIVVDNGSTDGTPAFLRQAAREEPRLRFVLNAENRGFARGNNQGLAVATGDVLVLLNNDTLLPPGWLSLLARQLEERSIGLVGPLTNRVGNEARIDVSYRTYGEFARFADAHASAPPSSHFDVRTAIMFCVALRREVYEEIGQLDERFMLGMFEDDDYAMRIRASGRRVICAADAFVHHFGEASFGQLAASGQYGDLFEANRHRLEEKWGVNWLPHDGRRSPSYEQMCDQLRRIVIDAVPTGSTVAVISRGDEAMLDLGNRRAWHFPQTEDGDYAGFYPASGADALAQVEAVTAKGADYMVVPRTAYWWLYHYGELNRYLHHRCQIVAREQDTCLIIDLRPARAVDADSKRTL